MATSSIFRTSEEVLIHNDFRSTGRTPTLQQKLRLIRYNINNFGLNDKTVPVLQTSTWTSNQSAAAYEATLLQVLIPADETSRFSKAAADHEVWTFAHTSTKLRTNRTLQTLREKKNLTQQASSQSRESILERILLLFFQFQFSSGLEI